MRRYETIIILRPNANEEEVTSAIDMVTATIEKDGGEIIKIDKWGLKKLGYLIKKEKQGYYLLLEFAGTPEGVAEFERKLRIDDLILKYMTIKLKDVYVPGEITEETEEETQPSASSEESTSETAESMV